MPQRITGSEGWEQSGVGAPGAPQSQELPNPRSPWKGAGLSPWSSEQEKCCWGEREEEEEEEIGFLSTLETKAALFINFHKY